MQEEDEIKTMFFSSLQFTVIIAIVFNLFTGMLYMTLLFLQTEILLYALLFITLIGFFIPLVLGYKTTAYYAKGRPLPRNKAALNGALTGLIYGFVGLLLNFFFQLFMAIFDTSIVLIGNASSPLSGISVDAGSVLITAFIGIPFGMLVPAGLALIGGVIYRYFTGKPVTRALNT